MSPSYLKIAHHHIYKCAGTTFAMILQKNFPGKVFHIEGEIDDYRITSSDIIPCVALGDWCAVSSHLLTLPAPEDKPADLHVVLLRDPIARLQSVFKYGKKIGQIPDRTTLDKWIASQSDIITDNFQARCCSPQSPVDPAENGGWSIDIESIDLTRKDILIGCGELFDETMILLENRLKLLGIPFNASYLKPMNRTGPNPFNESERHVIDTLKARNVSDYSLLEAVSTNIIEELKRLDQNGNRMADYKHRCTSIHEEQWQRFHMPPLTSWSWIKPETRQADRRPLRPGILAKLKKDPSRPWVRDWGPRQSAKGVGFNVQQNGNSSFWVIGHNLRAISHIYMGGNLLGHILARPNGEILSAQVPEILLAIPGEYDVVAITRLNTCYPLGKFQVFEQ